MINYQEAIEKVLSVQLKPGREFLPLFQSRGRFLGEAISAPWPLPRFDNSAMDGYAVVAEDLKAARQEAPVSLPLVGESAAGDAYEDTLKSGECIRISTGAQVPQGADAVVPLEIVEVDGNDIRFSAPASPWQYVRRLGSDVAKGQKLFGRGTLVTPEVLSLLAYYNIAMVDVFRRPRVGILTSGDEILPHGTQPSGSQIIGSSIYYLEHELTKCGCEARLFGISPDDATAFKKMFAEMLDWADILVTTAGVSVGEHDIVGRAVRELGGDVVFWRVAVRPGKPFLFARFGEKLHFGFPGNPVSTCCNTEIFLKPFLRQAFGVPQLSHETATLGSECPRDRRRLFFIYTRVQTEGGKPVAYPLPNQNSGNILLPAMANALIVADPDEIPIPAGEEVSFIPINQGL